MNSTGKTLEIVFQGNPLQFEVYASGKQELYRFMWQGKPLFVTKAKDADKRAFWTSVPQGYQELAESLGELIDKATGDKQRQSNEQQPTLF